MSELYPPDTEGTLRAYLRAEPDVAGIFGNRIFFGVDDPSAFPVCTIQRIGGGQDGGTAEGQMDVALIQLDVWGDVHDKGNAWTATAVILGALGRLSRYTDVPGTILYGANVTSYIFLADPSNRARYSITAQVLASGIG